MRTVLLHGQWRSAVQPESEATKHAIVTAT